MPRQLFTLEIDNRLAELERVAAWVQKVADGIGLAAKDSYRLDMILSELVTNVIDYAFDDGATHRIQLQAQATDVRLDVELIDDGRAFDPLERPEPNQPKTLEEAPIGGLGIHLVRHNADACRYRREDGKNHFIFSLEIPS